MAKVIYRVVSACGALGYGFPRESLQKAMLGRVDALVSDAGSMDAGPYFLGTGTEYFEREAVKSDFRQMVEAGQQIDGPVILGSCGMAGGDRNVEWMLDVAREVFEEMDIRDAKVAVISSELEPAVVIDELRAGTLRAVGKGPELDEASLRDSTIVGQMGIHPILSALESGAKYIFAGRACDVALFAADMVRRGIAPGLAYHVGHVLECGALACDPGSPSDCLVAEIYDDGSAVFTAPDESRRCTPYSIAAHSLYEEAHPQLQFYPEGVLAMADAEFFAVDARSAGIRKSRFYRTGKPWPLSIKLEGAHRVGLRKVSLIHLHPSQLQNIPADVLVYGRNGVQQRPVSGSERELGIVVQTRAHTAEAATKLASLLTHYLIHYGYPGRESTAGNIAYPLSPNLVNFRYPNGDYGAIVPSGTRDPIFIAKYASIRQHVIDLVRQEFPQALVDAKYEFVEADAERPVALLRTTHTDAGELAARHRVEIDRIAKVAAIGAGSLLDLDAADAYEWTLYHLLQNEEVIRNRMFPIRHYLANGREWSETGETRATYFDIGEPAGKHNLDDRTLSVIEDLPPRGEPVAKRRLLDMARVIRSKD
ncbi:MAG TPA: acyclic terpene utilization AtuA family protein, partial [Paraburkholderia sp.]|nr:acyclic terpene utilization AtuA family protein [Paraburkholderia sp.]